MPVTGWDDAVIAAAAILGALTVIAGTLYKLYGVAKRIDSTIGVDDSGRTLSQRLMAMEDAVLPHGRESLPARVDHIEGRVERMAVEVSMIRDVVVTSAAASSQYRKQEQAHRDEQEARDHEA